MPEKILIVDDDIDSLKLIGLMLQRHGYEVVAANAGNQAVSKAISEKPSLIILDVMMPDMDGYEVTRRLRSDIKTQNIPIIMFTAKSLIEDKVVGFEAGADDYLTKPTHPAELASRVKAILARNTTKAGESKGDGANGSGGEDSRAIGVLGVKGGVGTTTIAINLGAALIEANEKPILADFCLGSGSMGLFLGHGGVSGMASLLSKPANEINRRTIDGQTMTHQTGLRLLLSSTRPKEALLNYSPETALSMLKNLRQMGNPVILDLGSRMSVPISRLIRELDQLLLVVEPNKVALTMARELFQTFETENINRSNISVAVMNRAQSNLQTPWQEIEQALGQEIKAIISAAPDLAFQAAEANMPMVVFRPNSITSSQLMKLAEDISNRMSR
jgi:CheY-like chemotaxis protein/MinD-like ATPase involved in chromosome partitioning or flagellar assembly